MGSMCHPGDTCLIQFVRDAESAAPDATTFTHVHGWRSPEGRRTGGRGSSCTTSAQVRPSARDVYVNTGPIRANERQYGDLFASVRSAPPVSRLQCYSAIQGGYATAARVDMAPDV